MTEHLNGLYSFFRNRWVSMLVFAAVFGVLFQVFVYFNTIGGREEQTGIIIKQNEEQTRLLTDQNTLLREQGNLIVCLLQLAAPDQRFTDQAECQRRASEAAARLQTGQDPISSPTDNDSGNPQGSKNDPADQTRPVPQSGPQLPNNIPILDGL